MGGGCFAAGEEAGDPAVAASGQGKEAGRVSGQCVESDAGAPSWVIHPCSGDKRAKISIPFAVLGEEDEMRCREGRSVRRAACSRSGDLNGQLGTNDSLKSSGLGGFGKTYGAAQIFVIGEGEGGHF